MINKITYYIIVFFIITSCFAQERTAFKGRVITGDTGMYNVLVINKKTGAEVKTNINGYFSIAAQPGDGLVVFSTKIVERQFVLNQDFFNNQPFVISVNYRSNEMDELVINAYGSVDEVSLGLVPANQKQYSVGERRLYFGMDGGIPLAYLINLISGRIAMAKRVVRTEKKEMILDDIRGMYNEDEITNMFGVPKEQVNGFMYYLGEDKLFGVLISKGRTPSLDFTMMNHAKEYLKIQMDGAEK